MNKPQLREGFVADEPAIDIPDQQPTAADPSAERIDEAEQWPIVVKLMYRPIKNNKGEEVRELTFREPSGGDINRYGNPVRINQEGDAIIDERKMTLIMAALSGILSPLLERMDPRDWNSCAYRLRNFFLPDFRAW
jgi:tail assembly chaperone E/41/14-like protein